MRCIRSGPPQPHRDKGLTVAEAASPFRFPRNLDPVLDAVSVLTPQLIDEGRFGIEPGAPVVTRSYQLKYWFGATICAAT